MIPTLSQVCSLSSPFETDIADYAAGKCFSVEVWLTKLETYLEQHSVDQVKELLAEHGVKTPVASFQGGLLTSQGERRKESWELFRKRLELCKQLGIGTIVVAGDIRAPLTQEDLDRAIASLTEIAQAAGTVGVRAAFEFQGSAAFANNLQTAAALISDVGSPHLGLCLDLFHFAVGPSKWADFSFLEPDKLFHVQLCDFADVARELATDSDRILPGEGELPAEPLIAQLREMGYAETISIELMNPQIWSVPALQFGEIAMTALERLLKSPVKP
jgi:4-hydroxyphenylpyruvate dioxygenase